MSLEHIPQNFIDLPKKLRDIIITINRIIGGGGGNSGELTLTAGATTTQVIDQRVSDSAVILLMPQTANAAAAVTNIFINPTSGSFTLTHANNGQTDRTFRYAIVGS